MMNRISIAVLMLLIAGVICGCEIFTVNNNAKIYTEELDKISYLSENENYQGAEELSKDILGRWKEISKHLDKYLYHDYIDNITEGISTLPVYTKNKDTSAVKAQIEEIKIQLTSLKESELPYLHNIL